MSDWTTVGLTNRPTERLAQREATPNSHINGILYNKSIKSTFLLTLRLQINTTDLVKSDIDLFKRSSVIRKKVLKRRNKKFSKERKCCEQTRHILRMQIIIFKKPARVWTESCSTEDLQDIHCTGEPSFSCLANKCTKFAFKFWLTSWLMI